MRSHNTEKWREEKYGTSREDSMATSVFMRDRRSEKIVQIVQSIILSHWLGFCTCSASMFHIVSSHISKNVEILSDMVNILKLPIRKSETRHITLPLQGNENLT